MITQYGWRERVGGVEEVRGTSTGSHSFPVGVVDPSQRSLQRVCSLIHQLSVAHDLAGGNGLRKLIVPTSERLRDHMRTAQQRLDIGRAEVGSGLLRGDEHREQ